MSLISADGWFTFAVRNPGPDDRWAAFGHATTPMDAIYHHSLLGTFNPVDLADLFYNVQEDPERFPTAWHWSVSSRELTWQAKRWPAGTCFQHYPVQARLQHANGGNVIGPGGETDGFNEPLTQVQVATWLQIHEAMREYTGKDYERYVGNGRVGLCEHREAPGAATACPSDRYAPLWVAVAERESDDVTREEYEALMKRVVSLEISRYQTGVQLFGQEPESDGRYVGDPAEGSTPPLAAYLPLYPEHVHTTGKVKQ